MTHPEPIEDVVERARKLLGYGTPDGQVCAEVPLDDLDRLLAEIERLGKYTVHWPGCNACKSDIPVLVDGEVVDITEMECDCGLNEPLEGTK